MDRSTRQQRRKATRERASRGPRGRQVPRGWIVGVVAAAVVAVGALIALGQVPPAAPVSTAAAAGKVKGDLAAPVTVEVWADFQCPACRLFAFGPERQLEETLVRDGIAKVRWRDLAFLGQESVWAAAAANCAEEQGQFWRYHDELYAEQAGENRGAFSKANLKRFAAELGLDQAQFNACLDGDRHVGQVRAETEAGRQQGVRATPTLFVNGEKLEGVPSFERLERLIMTHAAAARDSERMP
jgi:protein-disulfide isomerase